MRDGYLSSLILQKVSAEKHGDISRYFGITYQINSVGWVKYFWQYFRRVDILEE
ncbi:MAG: hypothetical protein ACE5K3_01490 [bacterium]